MSASNPITQRDVAEACGLHPSTVCLALKNSPSIPPATRQRIQAVAEELGYCPNVAARNLALLRGDRKAGGSLPIAWINQEARRDHWRCDAEAGAFFEGARRRAAEAGYHLEEIWTREPGMTAARVAQIVAARGIEGVIFPSHRSFDFALLNAGWSEAAMVGLNDHRLGEWVDVVCPDYYRNTSAAWHALRALDFERIGLVLTSQFDAASNGLAHACFLRHQLDVPQVDRMPVCFSPTAQRDLPTAVGEWYRDHRPDAVLCCDAIILEAVREAGCEAEGVELHGGTMASGIDAAAGEVAAAAVDCVVEKMRRFERGPRDSTRVHLVRGAWQERALGRVALRTVA